MIRTIGRFFRPEMRVGKVRLHTVEKPLVLLEGNVVLNGSAKRKAITAGLLPQCPTSRIIKRVFRLGRTQKQVERTVRQPATHFKVVFCDLPVIYEPYFAGEKSGVPHENARHIKTDLVLASGDLHGLLLRASRKCNAQEEEKDYVAVEVQFIRYPAAN